MNNNIIYTYLDINEDSQDLCFNCAVKKAAEKQFIDAYMITNDEAYDEYNMKSYYCTVCGRLLI